MTTDWAIPQQAKLKYTQLFNFHDRSRSGFLSGLQCRDILLQSGLARNVLAEIWNLSDIDGDGQLTREEFILAMHLTNYVRSGQSLPNELPPDLVPPSYRRTRSISTTSVHSATSAGSSTSASGTTNDEQLSQGKCSNESATGLNSFENKRRENFEKGRAELERRRLKMIEQQMSVLAEQLVASKKQVAEAKSKIDSMRSERDTKMGLITSLEAQLKTVQDKKAYLNHEEQNLIAIAKDLNLVNPNQAELDQLATQAKQQSINQMKEKIVEFAREKEAKVAETEKITERLEESKKELNLISEKVSKAYESYKDKVANAKVVRAQIIDENKSQVANLDSAWDAAPAFTPISQPNNRLGSSSSSTTTNVKDEDPWNFIKTSNDQQNAFNSFSENNESPFSLSGVNSKLAKPSEGDGFEDKIPEPSKTIKRYRALYAFEARNPDELTINPGDIISGSEVVCEPGWLSGQLNGQTGLFPEAYVEPFEEDAFLPTTNDMVKKDGFIKSEVVSSHLPSNELSESIQSNTSTASGKTAIKYKVVYAFDARNPDELTINPGDIIIGIEGAHEPGWLMGQSNDQKGLFPEAYVEKLVEKVQADQPEVGGKSSRSKKAEVATVIANYRALGQEQLNLEKGQLVLIRRKMDSGWWEGEIQVKDNFVKSNKRLGGVTSHQCELSHLINELVGSESDYINDLRLCQETYIEPLSRSFDVSNIFMKWDQLMQLHELAMLRISSSTSFESGSETFDQYRFIFEVFHDLLSSLVEVYIQVCSNQRESTRLYEAALVSDIRFKQLVSDCQRNTSKMLERQLVNSSENQQTKEAKRDKYRTLSSIKLPLTNFLLKPMQRITKYSLIFDRILKVINQSGPKELENLVIGLKLSAQTLCEKVNEACRSKEDNEDNKSKLQWAQSHIKQQPNLQQQQQSLPSPSTTDLSSLESKYSILSCVSQESSRTKDINNLSSSDNELIIFDSKTNCLGERKFIKSGSFVKFKSGKELVLFLFNDLLLLTQVKGNSSSIRVEDAFQSIQAQQAYYKLYKPPILVEDIILLDHQTTATDHNRSIKKNSITDLQPHFVITFSDKSNGIIYNLIPLNAQEKISWTKELSQRSVKAREARAEYQARQAALLFKPLSRKPSVSECIGRLFIGILEINQYTGVKNSSISSQNFIRSSGNYSSLNFRINSQNLLASTSKVSIQLQLKRLEGSVGNIIRYDEPTETTSNEGKDLIPISDIYSTKTVAINPSGYSLNTSNDLSIEGGGGDICAQLELVRFSDEGTQFLIRKKSPGELEDFIDIGLFDEAKFRETKLIARKRVNLDQLLQQQLQPNLLIDQPVDLMSTSSYDQLKQPFDCVFKMRLLKSLHEQPSHNNRSSLMDNRRSRHFNETTKSLTSSMRESTGISIRMRFHFQLFCDTD